jgi:mannose-6-phosphate isomerase
MLSIQVHPTKSEAEAGFVRENALGVPLDAPERNYKDNNHKPEVQLALSDFWLLHGFRPQDQLHDILTQTPEFHTLAPLFINSGYHGLYKHIMEMPPEAVNALLHPLAQRILPKYDAKALDMFSPDYWAAKAIREMSTQQYDRGIFSIYLFNLVKLAPGQALFQDAGIPHVLLHGQTLEIMANSDNVIRGGLTPKSIDIPELLKLVTFKGITAEIIEGRPSKNLYEEQYVSPSQEFSLSKISLSKDEYYENTTDSAEILLTLQGEAMLDSAGTEFVVNEGASAIVFAGKHYQVRATSESALLFREYIPYVPASM